MADLAVPCVDDRSDLARTSVHRQMDTPRFWTIRQHSKIDSVRPRRLAAQDIALSRRRSPVRIRSGLPRTSPP